MKMSVSKNEVFGVVVSILAMVAILMYLNKGVAEEAISDDAEAVQDSRITVAENTNGNNSDLARAIADSASGTGELVKLVIDDQQVGEGDIVKEGDTVTVHYIGATREGVQFDSSHDRGQPFTFTIGEGKVIEGWEAGIIGMQVGGKRILIIPPSMGYGNTQVGPIPANSILVFAVDLISINE